MAQFIPPPLVQAQLVQDFIFAAALRAPAAPALCYQGVTSSYAELARMVRALAGALSALGRGERLAVYLEKREEAVVAMFGAAAAGAVFVPVNPLLKPGQVAYILADCGVRALVTSAERLATLAPALAGCAELRTVILCGGAAAAAPLPAGLRLLSWRDCMEEAAPWSAPAGIDSDLAAILYTSGSTGKPKGVVLSHRNLVAGALSVAGYLENRADDRILCLLPLSFDYGLSQLTTAFCSGACAVLINHLLLRDVVETVERERITGLAAVPPLWVQLAQLSWSKAQWLRYITNSGGTLQRPTVQALRRALPMARIYLMYGLTEAFRSTYLAPEQIDRRPDSIGKAIPNAEVLVLRGDGSAERFRPLPGRPSGLPFAELAVWSGDTVRRDEEGYLYFVGRGDEMIKTSGYRVSPTEVEEVLYASGLVGEAVALGVPHAVLGQAIVVLATAPPGCELDGEELLAACKAALPGYMVPSRVEVRRQPLPRNPNGKIDRRALADGLAELFTEPR
ncbi:AMP-binding protein [Rugamonas sp. CCM 8940]|uniref:AMP-binding protein n=1 Tax=Rugamonas sp. CCM 8940 TaxID=2765359 RepID=UPI0018F714A4|nr:AMP-binding protein [Rugamonas sp. CCM 8940]MBJ7310855.1 AMP-binding protein [Rugamonas sp. CCM 8940]